MLDRITPIILTYNEAPNIGRCLDRLKWAREVIVIDSFSNDATLEIVAKYPNVRVVQNAFDSFADQLNFALEDAELTTDWALRLDSDYMVTDELEREISALNPGSDIAGYRIAFTYCVHGRPLRASLYPADVILFRHAAVRYVEDGHCERVRVNGPVAPLSGRVLHDDRKSMQSWLAAQGRYMSQERDKLLAANAKHLDLPDRLRRKRIIAPLIVLVYALFWKGLILDGMPGLLYAFQRTVAEFVLSLYLLEQRISNDDDGH